MDVQPAEKGTDHPEVFHSDPVFGSFGIDIFPGDGQTIVVDGYRVPYITIGEQGDGTYNLILDNRMGISGSKEEVAKWVRFIADAMAVSAGYSAHGPNSCQINRHGPSIAHRVMGEGSKTPGVPTDDGDAVPDEVPAEPETAPVG